MAAYQTGYEDERFQYPVGQSFHCSICLNVFKDPVKCCNREHLFCRNCIMEHLKNQQNCPICQEPLTVDTLAQPAQTVTNLLAELKIRCEFFKRGCGKFFELGNLDSHLRECGFAPAVCSNEGCQLEVNKQDLLHHETVVCELRRVQCHSCNEIRQEMDIVKVNLAAMNVKLATIEQLNNENQRKNETTFEIFAMNVKTAEDNMAQKAELVQEQLDNQKVSIQQVQSGIVEMKKSLTAITKQLENITRQTSNEDQEATGSQPRQRTAYARPQPQKTLQPLPRKYPVVTARPQIPTTKSPQNQYEIYAKQLSTSVLDEVALEDDDFDW